MKFAVIGANGKVGTELCFLLKEDVDVIPIVRNRLGAIFLKHNDFTCRIADISREQDAKENLHDVDVVVIAAYATDHFSGSQSQTSKKINEKLIKNSVRFSSDNAVIIYLSTIRAFSYRIDPNTSRWSYRKYDKEKQYLERFLLSECRKRKKRGFPLRIGHVFGDNQPRTKDIKKILTEKKISVQTHHGKISNVVHTVTLKDAIMKCTQSEVKPRVYSVVNQPQWTWEDVFEYYNDKKIQIEFKPSSFKAKNSNGFLWKILKANKKFIIPILYFIPSRFDLYFQRQFTMKRMMLAISSIKNDEIVYSSEELTYKQIPGPFLSGLVETKELLKNFSSKVFDIT
jgi:dTDP-4-dehydrorhamnose reductase